MQQLLVAAEGAVKKLTLRKKARCIAMKLETYWNPRASGTINNDFLRK
jgi:hypothetical protein